MSHAAVSGTTALLCVGIVQSGQAQMMQNEHLGWCHSESQQAEALALAGGQLQGTGTQMLGVLKNAQWQSCFQTVLPIQSDIEFVARRITVQQFIPELPRVRYRLCKRSQALFKVLHDPRLPHHCLFEAMGFSLVGDEVSLQTIQQLRCLSAKLWQGAHEVLGLTLGQVAAAYR